jgi:hypothetical protein
MSETPETRAEHLMRTSEMYRRLRSEVAPAPSTPAVELARDLAPVDTVRAVAPDPEEELSPRGPTFLRRMVTRRIDPREVMLILIVIAVWFANRR